MSLVRPLLVAALWLGLVTAPAAQAQFCADPLGDPISTASIPLNTDQFSDIDHFSVVVFGNPNETYESDGEDPPSMDVTVYDGPDARFRCLVLQDATPPEIGLAFGRRNRFIIKTSESGDPTDELRLLADLETGELVTPSDVWIEIQEAKVVLGEDPPVGPLPDCDEPSVGAPCVEKKKTIPVAMGSGTTLRPGCGNRPPENVEGESIYSDRGEFTIQGADCINEFGGAQAFDAPFLFRLSGPMRIICQDGYDNDGDGDTDFPADMGCMDELDLTEELSCENGLDDDGDTTVDFPDDPGCASAADDSELDPTVECDDGVDNDGDSDIDFPADEQCLSPAGVSEVPEPALALLQVTALGLLAALRRRRA